MAGLHTRQLTKHQHHGRGNPAVQQRRARGISHNTQELGPEELDSASSWHRRRVDKRAGQCSSCTGAQQHRRPVGRNAGSPRQHSTAAVTTGVQGRRKRGIRPSECAETEGHHNAWERGRQGHKLVPPLPAHDCLSHRPTGAHTCNVS